MTTLVAALQADSAAKRWQTIEHLSQSQKQWLTEETLSMLIKALADSHPFVRWQAGLALVSQAEGAQKLTELLKNSSVKTSSEVSRIYVAAIDALGKSQLPNAHIPLLEALNSDNALLRQSAAEALANLKAVEAVPALIAALQDTNAWVRRGAAYALGHIGSFQAIEALVQCLYDNQVIVRRSAAYALGALRAQSALPQLKISLTDQDPITRRNATWAIGRLGTPEATAALQKILNDPQSDAEAKATAGQAIEIITKPRWLQLLLGVKGRLHQ
ncbi:MAG: HEAT repeat domain-containing protein [Anaerolineae bacterium]|nr:HEAT repeat domain-containing protein [Anaerolineae bacterium]